MNKSITKTMSVAAAALTLCMAAGGAFAQAGHLDNGPNVQVAPGSPQFQQRPGVPFNPRAVQNNPRGPQYDQRGGPGYGYGPGYRGERQDFRPGREMDRRGFPQPRAEWRRGGRVPPEYRGRNYVVSDYRMHHLNPPPRGYQWVGVGGDFVLAAVATGIIAQIISGQ